MSCDDMFLLPASVPVDLPLKLSIQTQNDTLVDLENATLKQQIQDDVSMKRNYITDYLILKRK